MRRRTVFLLRRNTWLSKSILEFLKKIADDLNTPQALAVLQQVLKSNLPPSDKHKTILDFDQVLGLGFDAIRKLEKFSVPDYVQKLIDARALARANKNWAESDRIRDNLAVYGIVLQDRMEGTEWTFQELLED